MRQSFDEGRARFDLDVKRAIEVGDAIAAAKGRGDTEIDTSTESDGGGAPESSVDDGTPKIDSQDSSKKKSKRSTEKGEARAKIISTWTLHHQYRDGGALNFEPIGVNELARQSDVSSGSVTTFFNEVFDGHAKYRSACHLKHPLLRALKEQNDDFSPEPQYDAALLDERDEDEADRWDQREREGA